MKAKNKKLIIKYFFSFLWIIIFIISNPIHGQMNSFYLNHDLYEFVINPAVTGRDYYPVVNFSQKKYWFGTENSPFATSIGAVMRMGNYNFYTPRMLLNKSSLVSKSRMGFGGFLMYEKDGPLKSFYSTISYAYYIPFSDAASELSFGLSARLQHNSVNQGMLDPLDEFDPELMDLNENNLAPDASFGVYYHSDQLSVGASANELFQSKKPFSNNYYNKRDIFVHGGYKFFLKRFELEPSVFIGFIDFDQIYYYSRLKFYYLTYNWISIAYRSTQSVNIALGLRLNRFYLAYAYELGVSKMIKYFDGSHEIMLGMNIGLYEAQGIRKVVK